MSANGETPAPAIPEEFKGALAKALKIVELRERFTSDLRSRLEKGGFAPEAIEFVVGFLTERKMLDDGRLVGVLLERRIGKRAMGRDRLRADLIAKGAPEDVVDECLATVPFEAEQDDLDSLVSSRARQGDSRAKVARFVFGRGYREDDIEAALERHFGSSFE